MAEANGDRSKALDSLLDSLNGSADRFQTLWFTFLAATLYLVVTAAATTHRMLLLGEQQTLPVVDIKVSLLPFFVIAPAFYFAIHLYVLLMLVLLARTASFFGNALKKASLSDEDELGYRARIGNSLFLQLLSAGKREPLRIGVAVLAWIALGTLVLAPLATLILIQMMFLPYHSVGITWWHRFIIFADLALALYVWHKVFGAENPLLGPRALRDHLRGIRIEAILVLVGVVAWMSLWEGRWAGETLASRTIGPLLTSEDSGRVVFGLVPIRLELENDPIVGTARYEEVLAQSKSPEGGFEGGTIHTLPLDGRDLQFANLFGSDLREVSLRDADMRGATMTAVRLDDADLTGAKMSGVDLRAAILRDYAYAHADFAGADLEGANLRGAFLGGAYLANASLQGADLTGANMSPSDLHGAHLQGADLSNARLQGANLQGAELQGAILTGAKLADADLTGAYVFGAQVSDLEKDDAPPIIGDIHVDAVKTEDLQKWKFAAMQFAPYGKPREDIAARFAALENARATVGQVDKEREKWTGLRNRHPSDSATTHRQHMAQLLGDLVCSAMGAPFAGHMLVAYPPKEYNDSNSPGYRLAQLAEQLSAVQDRIKGSERDPNACRGSVHKEDWPALDAIKPVQEPASSNAPVRLGAVACLRSPHELGDYAGDRTRVLASEHRRRRRRAIS